MIREGGDRGVSLLEALFVLLLMSMVVPGAWALLVRGRTAGSDVARRAEGLETVRTIAWLLPEETSSGRPGLDWSVGRSDSLSLRAFRGFGLVRADSSDGRRVRVCVRGSRLPAPGKDSVLVLGTDGHWRTHDLEHRRVVSLGCPGIDGGREEEWTVSPGSPPAVLARVFERGSYHLAQGALRYRRGEGGRQPVTPERIQEGAFLGPGGGGNPFAWQISLRKGEGDPPGVPGTGRPWRGAGW